MAVPESVRRGARAADIAVFDATTLAAKGVKDQLEARSFPARSVRLFTSSLDPDTNLTEFKGEAMLVTVPDIDTLSDLDIAFFCGTRQDSERYIEWPARAGFAAIDLSGASAASAAVPLVNASVNPEAVGGGAGLIAAPQPIAQMLSTLLAPIHTRCGLEEAVVMVLQPASEHGQKGIDELYQQALSLMNFQEMPSDVFGRQLAFNAIPGFIAEEKRATATRADLETQVKRVIGAAFGLTIQVIQAPLFHGHAALAHLTLREGKGREDLLASFRGVEDISVARPGDPITPVERAGKADLLVAGAQPSGLRPTTFWLWASSDHLAGGQSRNAVRIAEKLLERSPRRRS